MRRRAARIGYDPWLHSRDWVKQATRGAGRARAPSWSPVEPQPDRRGLGRPARAVARRGWSSSPTNYAGKQLGRQAPRHGRLAGQGRRRRGGARGARFDRLDVQRARRRTSTHTPVALAFALVHADGTADLFVEGEKVGDDVRAASRQWRPAARARPSSRPFARRASRQAGRGRSRAVGGGDLRSAGRRPARKIIAVRDPAVLPKAIKNEVEIAGHQAAQARDGAAVSRFLHWVEEEAPKGELDELIAADKLRSLPPGTCASFATCRFDTISGAGPNGAIAHYKVEREDQPAARDRHALPGRFAAANIRTAPPTSPAPLPIGEPTAEMSDRFTRVLQGHIAHRHGALPQGHARVAARQLRPAAAVGSGPRLRPWHRPWRRQLPRGPRRPAAHLAGRQRAVGRRRAAAGRHDPFQRARLLQDRRIRHPHRESGAGGRASESPGAEKEMLGFETLTFAPIDRRLIDARC